MIRSERFGSSSLGDPLAPDTYTVTLRSGNDGFKRADGTLLDGDGDGATNGDYRGTFTVTAPASNAVTVSVADFVRGPGQDVNVPANTSAGIPVSIRNGTGVRNAGIQIDYDPNLLTITGASVGAAMPAGATVTIDNSTAGAVVLELTSPMDLPAGSSVLANLQATVPTADAVGIYGRQHVLNIHSVTISDASGNTLPVVDDDALHLVNYFADVSGNGRINSADASLVARFAALIDVPEIPQIPGGIVIVGVGGPEGIGTALMSLQQNAEGAERATARTRISASDEADSLPIYYPAVDAVMAALAYPVSRYADEGNSNLVLEDVFDRLLSVLNDKELAARRPV